MSDSSSSETSMTATKKTMALTSAMSLLQACYSLLRLPLLSCGTVEDIT